ncbi:hypothetical protein IOMTU157_1921 [Citrobacter portucalensis]|nr:hypothetical protein IOMTU157_1921 [Citrobacter portucalensis]
MQIIGQMNNYLSITQQRKEVTESNANNKAIIINSYAKSTRQKQSQRALYVLFIASKTFQETDGYAAAADA